MIYEFAATQDLHGWGKPWGPGAGKNKLPIIRTTPQTLSDVTFTPDIDDDGNVVSVTINGTATEIIRYVVADVASGWAGLSSDSYIGNNKGTPGASDFFCLSVYNDESVYISDIYAADVSISSSISRCIIYVWSGATFNNVVVKPMIRLASVDDASYAPYSNICPPEGFNIWDPSQDKMIPVYAGYVNANTRELYLRPVYKEYAGEELVGPWMSSLDEYSEDATPTEGAFVIDFGGELTSYEITPFMLQTLLDSLGIRQHFTDGAGLLNSLMDQAQGRVRSEEELLHLSRPLNVIAIGDQLPVGLTFKPISKDVLPGLPGKFIR